MRHSRLVLPVVLVALISVLLPATDAAATGRGGWNHLGNGGTAGTASLNGTVSALHAVGSTALYVGGNFTNAGGIAKADRIAKWSGSSWSAVGAGFGVGSVFAIAHYGGKIYAGGNFQNAGGNPDADNLAVFDGTSWAPFCDSPSHAGPTVSLEINALQVVGTTLYAGGGFQNGAGLASADYLLACDLTTGAPSSTVSTDGDFTGPVYTLTADVNGLLYAGGPFSNLDGDLLADRVASYDGTWQALGNGGITGIVRNVAAHGTDVYVSTDMLNIDGQATADHLATWHGASQTWSAMGADSAGTNGWFPATAYLNSIVQSGSLVFATGTFLNANGVATADNVAYFDGANWHALGSNGAGDGPWSGNGLALAMFKGQVLAGGSFTSAGGDTHAWGVASRGLRLPDGQINTAIPSGLVGNNIYNTTAVGQRKTMSINRGTSQYFAVYIQNDGLVPARFLLHGQGSGTGYTVRFIDHNASADITTAVRAGTFATPSMAPGTSFLMRMEVKVSASAANSATFTLAAKNDVGAVSRDVVKGHVNAT